MIVFLPSTVKRKNKIFNILLTICVLWALTVPATAQVYKWVDEKGVTHYGERAPQGKKAEAVEQRLANPGPAPGKAAQPNWKQQDLDFRRRQIKTEQTEAASKQREDQQRAACKQARDRLALYKSARGSFHLDEKDERVWYSDAEHNASIARQEQQVSKLCR